MKIVETIQKIFDLSHIGLPILFKLAYHPNVDQVFLRFEEQQE
jgi:hypothetical protein